MVCPKCGKYNIRFGGSYYVKSIKFKEQRLICNNCNISFIGREHKHRKFTPLISLVCPYCSKNPFNEVNKITYEGRYYVKSLNNYEQRYLCLLCKKSFINRKHIKIRKYDENIKKKIVELYNTKKDYINKFDMMKKTTYSTREISKLTGVSKSVVANLTKNN